MSIDLNRIHYNLINGNGSVFSEAELKEAHGQFRKGIVMCKNIIRQKEKQRADDEVIAICRRVTNRSDVSVDVKSCIYQVIDMLEKRRP